MFTFPSATSCWRLLLRGGFKRFLPTYEAICYRSYSNSPSLTSKELRSIWCALFRSESRTVKLWKSVYNVAGAYGLPRQGMESTAVVAPRGWHWVTRTLPILFGTKGALHATMAYLRALERTNERTGNGYLGSNFTICTGTANVCRYVCACCSAASAFATWWDENSIPLLMCSWVGKLKYERDCFQSRLWMRSMLCVFRSEKSRSYPGDFPVVRVSEEYDGRQNIAFQ